MHAGVRGALGSSAAQAGSLNAPGRLRFDFTSPTGAVPPAALAEIEEEVNSVLQEDREVQTYETTMDEARKLGAMMLFGEKYGDRVRVVDMGDYSRELCGGTHVRRSGELGLVRVLSEASIGSGVRRVEALVGLDAFKHATTEHVLVNQLAEQLKARPEELPDRDPGPGRAAAHGRAGPGEAPRRRRARPPPGRWPTRPRTWTARSSSPSPPRTG